MMRNDSASVISSLQMHYGDSDDDEADKKNTSGETFEETNFVTSESNNFVSDIVKSSNSVTQNSHTSRLDKQDTVINNGNKETDEENEPDDGLISDDEDSVHPKFEKHSHHGLDILNIKEVIGEAVKTESPSSQGSTNPGKKAARLVSYGPDEDLDEDESSDSDSVQDFFQEGVTVNKDAKIDTSVLSRSVQNLNSDDIKIPPEPIGKCSFQLQKKIEDMYDRMRREGLDLNRAIQNKKNFRNPSIYEKLIDFCHIDEKGTNFPPEIYDPHIWGKESLYDELDKVQRKEMEKREKEKKTKIEFMMGTKKSSTASSDGGTGPSDEKKRKTKWDTQPMIQVSKIPSNTQNPGVVNLTAVVTGTKATVIPAVGSLSKKPSSGK